MTASSRNEYLKAIEVIRVNRNHNKMLLRTLVRVKVLNPKDRIPPISSVVKQLRGFSLTLKKIGLIDSCFGLRESKTFTIDNWPDRWQHILELD